jgi:hypothetical protein
VPEAGKGFTPKFGHRLSLRDASFNSTCSIGIRPNADTSPASPSKDQVRTRS